MYQFFHFFLPEHALSILLAIHYIYILTYFHFRYLYSNLLTFIPDTMFEELYTLRAL